MRTDTKLLVDTMLDKYLGNLESDLAVYEQIKKLLSNIYLEHDDLENALKYLAKELGI